MNEIIKLVIGILFLIAGFFFGNLLARFTKEELKSGQRWFKLITILGLLGGVLSLVFRNDVLMFSLFFIAIVASRSIKRA